MVPVFPSSDSDESVEVDLSLTMKGSIPRKLIEAGKEGKDLPFEVCPNRFTTFQNFESFYNFSEFHHCTCFQNFAPSDFLKSNIPNFIKS